MGIRAAFTSAIRAALRPSLIVPAAFIAVIALMSPPAIEDASAQGFRMPTSRGSFSGGGPGRVQMSGGMGGMMSAGTMSKSGLPTGMSGSRRPGSVATLPGTGGMGGMGMGGGRPPGTNTGDTRPPEGRSPSAASAALSGPADLCAARASSPCPGADVGPPPNVSGGGGGGGGGGQPPSGNQPPPTNWGRYVPNEVVVEVASNVSPQTIAAMLRRHRPHAARSDQPPVQQHVDPAPAHQRPASGADGGARAGGRRILTSSRTLSRRCRKPPRRRQRRCPILSNMRWRGCGCRRRIRSPTVTAC